MLAYQEKGTPLHLCPKNRAQLASLFQVSEYILRKWIDKLGPEVGPPVCGLYSVNQIMVIIRHYGVPCDVIKTNTGQETDIIIH